VDVFSFGPILIRDGIINEQVYSYYKSLEPRQALGMISPGHYLLISVQGRVKDSRGTTLRRVAELLRERGASLVVHDTICAQVANRHQRLLSFAREHDIILFVSGRSSSNGKVLSDLCRSVNPRTYVIGGTEEINPAWFRDQDRVGICGATSTPKWLLEEVANAILRLP
jgi:4-hydroxy-3-methylbut-2-enyl diphosphate reductase